LLTTAFSTQVAAQASLQVPLQFDFLNPGARSLALGSAFAALADDATSAFTNPAGLTILRFPEVSFEGRGRRLESPFLQSGRLSGTVTGQGVDTIANAVYGDSVSSDIGPSYFSFVYPHRNFAVAAYRHELVRLDQTFEAQGVFQGTGLRELALQGSRNVSITTYGGSAAYLVHPRVSLGGGITISTFDLESSFDRFFTPGFFGAPTFDPATKVATATQEGKDTAVGFAVGGLFKVRDKPASSGASLVQLGIVYRKAPDFAFSTTESSTTAPAAQTGTFQAPDIVGVGGVIRFAQSATITAEVTHLRYASLKDDFIDLQAAASGRAGNFTIDNGTELHAGFEYVFSARGAPSVRVGTWYDPDHSVRYESSTSDLTDERFKAYLPGGEDQTHFTFGAGVAPSNRFEINFGGDLASNTRIFSVSIVARFGQ